MRRSRFGWLLLAVVAFGAAACGDTENRKKGSTQPQAGAGGDDTGGSGTAGATAGAAESHGGSRPSGGSVAIAGESAGGADGGASPAGGGGATDVGGAGGEGGRVEACTAPTSLAILGNYVEPNGDELWLRDSGRAVTLTRVTPGKPSSAKLPSLWQVVRVCTEASALVLKNAAGTFTRLDYLEGTSSLTVCLATATAATPELAAALTPADRANTIDSGCNDGPWTRAVKGDN